MARAESAQLYVENALEAFEVFPDLFMTEAVMIKTPNGRQRFDLRPDQRSLLTDFSLYRFNIVTKARQVGFSTLVSSYMLWRALFREDEVIDIFADKELSAKKLIRKVKFGYERLPRWLKDALPKPVQTNMQAWTFDNGSSIEAFTATKDSGRGESATLVVLDEWASYREDGAEKAWAAIEPTIDIGGQFIGGSSAQGLESFFKTMWDEAAGDPEWRRTFVPYNVVPHRGQQWWERRMAAHKRRGTEWIMHQEYPRDPDEAFVKSGNVVFDSDRLIDLAAQMLPPIIQGYLDYKGQIVYRAEGPLHIWQTPVAGADYVIGADVAEGLERGDFSDATVMAASDLVRGGQRILSRGEVVARWRDKIDPDEFGDVLDRLGRMYGTALVGVESNNHGIATLSKLRSNGYPRVYRQRTLDTRTKTETERLGWMTTRRSKPYMIDGLGAMIRTGELIFYDDRLRRELLSYIRQPNGVLGDRNIHDDAVMSAAIAAVMLEHVHEAIYRRPDEVPAYGSLAWMLKEAGMSLDPTEPTRKKEAWM